MLSVCEPNIRVIAIFLMDFQFSNCEAFLIDFCHSYAVTPAIMGSETEEPSPHQSSLIGAVIPLKMRRVCQKY